MHSRFNVQKSFFGVMIVSALAISGIMSPTFAQHAALSIVTSSLDGRRIDSNVTTELSTVSNAFEDGGFTVTQVANGTDEAGGLNAIAGSFLEVSEGFDSRLVYVSGRTVTIDGTVYLLPTTAQTPGIMDIAQDALNLTALAGALAASDVTSLLMVNGAYRISVDNVLIETGAIVSASETLALADFGVEQSVILSTTNGVRNIARNSRSHAFGSVVGDVLSAGGVTVSDAINQIIADTRARSGRRQVPQFKNFSSRIQKLGQPPAPPINVTEQRLWDVAVRSASVDGYTTYLDVFPNGVFADQAVAAIATLQPREIIDPINDTYFVVRNANLRSGPGTQFQRVNTLAPYTLVSVIGKVRGERWLKLDLDGVAQAYIFETLVQPYAGSQLQTWNNAQNAGTSEAYARYLDAWPKGEFADLAFARYNEVLAAEEAVHLAPYGIVRDNGNVRLLRRANVRDLPDSSGNRIATLAEGTILPLIGRATTVGWVQVGLSDGTVGYIWGALVEDYVEVVEHVVVVEDQGEVRLELFNGEYRFVNSNGRTVDYTMNGSGYGSNSDRLADIVAVEPAQTGRGYDLLVFNELNLQYDLWGADRRGRFIGQEPSRPILELESRFGLDLDENGFVGTAPPKPVRIESRGSVALYRDYDGAHRAVTKDASILLIGENNSPLGRDVDENSPWDFVHVGHLDGLALATVARHRDGQGYLYYEHDADGSFRSRETLSSIEFANKERAFGVDVNEDGVVGPLPSTARSVDFLIGLSQPTRVYAGPSTSSRVLGTLGTNVRIRANQVEGNPSFYRFNLNGGGYGYVPVSAGHQLGDANSAGGEQPFRFNLGGIDFSVKLE